MSDVSTPANAPKVMELRGVLPMGTRLRNYELTSILGHGGFGITYGARDTTLGRDVAIKEYLPTALALRENGTTVLPRSTDLTEEFVWGRERFLEEARTLAKLDRASAVIRVYDFLEEHGTAYMVMALAQGQTLQQHINSDGVLSALAVERILYPLLDGLEQVHSVGFLHRDIKPANIVLDSDGSPTLIDFGASRAAMAGRTTAMTAVFTPGYAAAEQFTSAKQGAWTDIYGLSATLYHAITGKPPPSAFERVLDDEYVALTKLNPAGFSKGLLAGIDAGLAVRASDRPQTIARWRLLMSQATGSIAAADATVVMGKPASAPRQASSNLLVSTPNALTPATPNPPPATRPPSKRLALFGGVAAAAIIVAGGGYLIFSPKPTDAPQTVAVQDLKAEDLRKLLDERVKADAAALEKRRLQEDAQRTVDAEAIAKKAADAELAAAQQRVSEAEEKLARLQTQMDAQRQLEVSQKEQADAAARRAAEDAAKKKAEVDIADSRQAEEEAGRKVAAEAEDKRQADEVLAQAQAARLVADNEAAVRRKAEEEAAQKATSAKQEADEEARRKADVEALAATEKQKVESVETALRLTQADRQRIQVALTSLGFDTRGTDGVLGPRSREMIAAWQKARNQPTTGFITASQQQALAREAATALVKYEEEQKRREEEKQKAVASAAPSNSTVGVPSSSGPAPAASAPAIVVSPTQPFDGAYDVAKSSHQGFRQMTVQVTNGRATGTYSYLRCGSGKISFTISPSGSISGEADAFNPVCEQTMYSVRGKAESGQLQLNINARGGIQGGGGEVSLKRR